MQVSSSTVVSATLLQNEMPVVFARMILSGPETRYSNIEKQMLAIVFGHERLYHHAWGSQDNDLNRPQAFSP